MRPRVSRGELLSGVPAISEELTQTLAVDEWLKPVSSSLRSLEK